MKEKITHKTGIYVLLFLFAGIFLIPFLWAFFTSLKHPGMVLEKRWIPHRIKETVRIKGKPYHIRLMDKKENTYVIKLEETGELLELPKGKIEELAPTLNNYREAVNILPFGRFFLNSLLVSLSIMFGQLITCSLGGYAFARLEFPGRDVVFMMYLATLMIPGQLLTIPLYLILRKFGLIDTYSGVILPGLFSAYGTFLLRQFFLTIPKDLEDAARIDGTGTFGIYWKIILPLSKAALSTLGIFVFVATWNDFFWPFIVLSDNSKLTLTVGLAKFNSLYMADWGRLMAGGMISLIPALIVYIIFQKYINRGIALTGLKE